jgi:hypothetical protein
MCHHTRARGDAWLHVWWPTVLAACGCHPGLVGSCMGACCRPRACAELHVHSRLKRWLGASASATQVILWWFHGLAAGQLVLYDVMFGGKCGHEQ